MPFQVLGRHLEEVVVVRPDGFTDDRGLFMETWRADQFKALGLPHRFAQENQSRSRKGVVRGLHFQWDPPMGKLMRVTAGRAYLVAVDLRRDSPTLGKHFGLEVDATSGVMVWAPPSFARGFCALEEGTDVLYKCTGTYNAAGESGIRWNDPALGIAWPVSTPILSAKDAKAQTLAEWLARPESGRFRRATASS
ncbi:MAG TPA: dTDP-4-dehydrorhamnose 3,5-epimerase [Candidatus Polarisedimenticolia bacterium]|nr:dTDP-4-dehydrorhamnose 3,5-epimerase [Candidatus Polarisedimenticolia bacterium]